MLSYPQMLLDCYFHTKCFKTSLKYCNNTNNNKNIEEEIKLTRSEEEPLRFVVGYIGYIPYSLIKKIKLSWESCSYNIEIFG